MKVEILRMHAGQRLQTYPQFDAASTGVILPHIQFGADDSPPVAKYPGDVRAALVPFLAFEVRSVVLSKATYTEENRGDKTLSTPCWCRCLAIHLNGFCMGMMTPR